MLGLACNSFCIFTWLLISSLDEVLTEIIFTIIFTTFSWISCKKLSTFYIDWIISVGKVFLASWFFTFSNFIVKHDKTISNWICVFFIEIDKGSWTLENSSLKMWFKLKREKASLKRGWCFFGQSHVMAQYVQDFLSQVSKVILIN